MLTRLGIIMSADPGDPHEVEGVLNPATAWGSDGELYLFPRLVAEGNVSRVGKARVIMVDGVPNSVERQGVVLEPVRSWERGAQHGGVEDPRITRIPSLDVHVMSYVAFGPFGPKPAVAISRDLESWTRLGPFQFEYDDALEIDLNLYPNKDVVFFPEAVPDPDGRPSYAVIHRPMWELWSTHNVAPLPAGTTDSRASIWISYIPEEVVRADISALTRPRGHRLVAGSQFEWESLKVGGGPPPIRVDEGWLLIHHGVSGTISDDPFVPQKNVFYTAGAMILSDADPSQVIARTPEPLLVPETPDELVGAVGNVVFPTAIESIEGTRYVFYGMADAKIGVARLERT
jgi:Predicted glycosylase